MRRVVLVVDDDETNRLLARTVLERSYDVVEAGDGPSALALIQRQTVDLVLLDVMMPGMTGIEVCRIIKDRPAAGFLPVLLLTGLSEQSDRNAGLQAGADDFLSKPFDRRELRLRVATFLRIREQDEEIRAQLVRLQEMDELKDDLVSLIVHDLRNPLTGAVALVETMQMLPARDRATDLATLQRLHDRACRLIEDLLTVRQLEEGSVVSEFHLSSLATPLRLAVETCTALAEARGVTLALSVDSAPMLPIDAGLVRRAVENLVSNAIKNAPRGSKVDVETQANFGGGIIRVGDRGLGIEAPVRERLFEKFAAVGTRSGTPRPGFGLGLYLVRLVASMHAGTVTASDREGGGTWFTVTLPGSTS